jgi:hypothetical protein
MSVPDFSFSNADVNPGRTPNIADPDSSDLFKRLTLKFTRHAASFLASHVGFEDDGFDWEGVRPLGEGSFGRVGLWVAKDNNGNNVKVRNLENVSVQELRNPGSRCQTMSRDPAAKDCWRSFGHETVESVSLPQYPAA